MDSGNVSAIISATAGIVGVVLGNSFVAIKELVVTRKKNEKDRAYLATLVVSHLDRFAYECMHVAFDDGTSEGRPAGGDGQYRRTTVRPPKFSSLDVDVEWKVLPKQLMYEILQIPDRQENIENSLAGLGEYDEPDYTEFFWTRQRRYAELSLYVSSVARKLRKHAEMPIEEVAPGEWSRDGAMRELIEDIDNKRAAWEKRMAESMKDFPTDQPGRSDPFQAILNQSTEAGGATKPTT